MNEKNILKNKSNEEIAQIIFDEFVNEKVLRANNIDRESSDYETQFWIVWEFLNRYKMLRGCIDKTAVGDPIADRLYSQFDGKEVDIVPVTFSTTSKHEMYKYLQQELFSCRLIIPYSVISEWS